MTDKLKSRKFWMAAVTGLLVILNDGIGLNLPSEAIKNVVEVVIAYIIGQGAVDAVSSLKK
jgi:uncharacterized membrane protein